MSAKRKCSLNAELQKEFPYIEKRPHLGDSISGVVCKICNKTFSIANGGKSSIVQHNNTSLHKTNLQAISSSKQVTDFFGAKSASSADLELAAKEGAIAYHTIIHDQSFRSLECTSKLIRTAFSSKFACAKTKGNAIVVNVLYPEEVQKLKKTLEDVKFVSVSIDCSNHKAIKLMPVVIRFFSKETGVNIKLLKVHSLTGETSDDMCEKVLETLEEFNLKNKVVSFCGDNANVNFGGQQRTGKNNVFYKLKTALNKDIIGVGCAAHIIHNSVRAATDIIPYDFESVLCKIYNHFSVYTLRTENLREFCEFVNVEFKTLLSTCKTRWLSLGPALERVLLLHDALKSYFISNDNSPVLKRFFEDPQAPLYMWFLHGQLHVFSQQILKLEKESVSAIETAGALQNLVESIQLRMDENFVGLKTKQILRELINCEEVSESKFYSDVQKFYETSITYIKNWGFPIEELKTFAWVNLDKSLQWNEVEESVLKLNEKGLNVSDNALFDEFACVQKYVTEEVITKWKENNTEVGDRWIEIFRHFSQNMVPADTIFTIVSYLLALPGSNAPVERVFSLVNNYWTDEKSQLYVETLEAVLCIKVNVKENCSMYYEKLKENPKLLRKIHSVQKYTY